MDKRHFMIPKSIQNRMEVPKAALCKDDYDEYGAELFLINICLSENVSLISSLNYFQRPATS